MPEQTNFARRRSALPALAVSALLAGGCVAVAQVPVEPPADARPVAQQASAPFGALSLFVLGGTLFAGLVGGIGLASLRGRKTASPVAQREPPASERSEPRRSSESVAPKQERLPPIVAELDGGGENDAAFWIEDIANGPRFGPRIVGVVVASDCDGNDALARLAAVARDTDHDLAIVDACQGAQGLAEALDLRLARPAGSTRRRDGARIEIVRLTELLEGRGRRNATAARDAFAALGSRVDVVLVDLPATQDWRKIPTLITALDDVALLRTEDTTRAELQTLCQAARRAGAPITSQVLVLDEAA